MSIVHIAPRISNKHNFHASLGSSSIVFSPPSPSSRWVLSSFSDVYFKNFAQIIPMSIICVFDSTDKRVHERGISKGQAKSTYSNNLAPFEARASWGRKYAQVMWVPLMLYSSELHMEWF